MAANPKRAARQAGLTYVNDDEPGIAREPDGDGFAYRSASGRRLRDARTLARIAALAIPPAYADVWISPDPDGHIQATGRDARGRKQYRYHPRWRAHRDSAKFGHMAEFGRALPAIRATVARDLARRDLSRARVLAALVRLLETTLVRIGNDEYARDNQSFGLTTLRSRHLRDDGAALRLDFRGKSGIRHTARIGDRRVATIVRTLHDLPGQRLFRYRGDDDVLHPIGSSDVNDYLRTISGADITAKDFRTWAACVRDTAALLRNTAAVCRAAYIHPHVFTGWRGGALSGRFSGELDTDEAALLAFLANAA